MCSLSACRDAVQQLHLLRSDHHKHVRIVLLLTLSYLMWLSGGLTAAEPGPRALDPLAAGIGTVIADAAFTDLTGVRGRLSDVAPGKVLLIAMISVDCPISRKYMPRLIALERLYRDRGVTTMLVDCTDDTFASVQTLVTQHALSMRVVNDTDHAIAKVLSPRTTTEVFLLAPDRQLLYRGAIDDRHGLTYDRDERVKEYLVNALDAVVAGTPIPLPATSAPGCELAVTADLPAITALTWHQHISRIVQTNCQTCHRPDGGAPFGLLSYEQVLRKRAVIKRAVSTRSMPPWYADPAVGGPWSNDRRLSEQDLRSILAWIAADCPEGDPATAPAPRVWTSQWEIGEPDAIIEVDKPITVPAEGRLPYQYVKVATNFPEDRWVQAVEMRPSAPEVVHHAQTFLLIGDKTLYDETFKGDGRLNSYFAAMVPGDCSQIYPPGTARLLPKGATMLFEIHYVPNGLPASDRMRLGLVFAKEKPTYEVHSFDIRCNTIAIPPGATDYVATAQFTLPEAARLLAFQPHMHLRGKSFAYDLILPDGTLTPLLFVPTWDFRWQLSYRMGIPLDVPAGSTLRVTGHFDNSEQNPANPDPTATVRTGGETTDEMLVGFGEWHPLSAEQPTSEGKK